MVWTTMFSSGIMIKPDAFIGFIFFSTFFVYNFHAFSNHLVRSPFQKFFHLFDQAVSIEQRFCVIVGLLGTVICYLNISFRSQVFCLFFGMVTLAYTLPLVFFNGQKKRLREISYVKILTVSLMWSLVTVVLPFIEYDSSFNVFTFLERMFFVYAITIPFEIRDMEQEKKIGVLTIVAIHGIENTKRLGYFLLLMFSILCGVHQYFYHLGINFAIPMACSAIVAGLLIYFTNEQRTKWYYKGFIDGTMILQYALLIIFNLVH